MHRTALQRAVTRASWPAEPLTVDGISTNNLLFSGPCIFRGYSLTNNNASATAIEVFDGLDTKGTSIDFINLAANASDKFWIGSPGVDVEIGLFITVTAGPLKGAFFMSPLDDLELTQLEREAERQAVR